MGVTINRGKSRIRRDGLSSPSEQALSETRVSPLTLNAQVPVSYCFHLCMLMLFQFVQLAVMRRTVSVAATV